MMRRFISTGWTVQWVDAAGGKHFKVMDGLCEHTDTLPEAFLITSSDGASSSLNTDAGFVSALWSGVVGETVSVRTVMHLNMDDMHATVSVTMKNVGTGPITQLYCKSVVVAAIITSLTSSLL
jgi:hypothetical protein